MGHAFRHALAQPERWALLASDERYLHAHVEEALRHSPPVDGWLRLTTADVTIDGVTIPAGSRCLVLIGTANHDAALHREPHVFDLDRAHVGRHLAFGAGPHHCVGAALGRLEMVTALRTLARRLPDLALDEDHQRSFKPSAALRQFTALPVSPTPGCPR